MSYVFKCFLKCLRVRKNDVKTINCLCNCYCRVLELESSGRRDEIRLHYLHEGQIRTETLPYRLADNRWHLVALGFSSHHCILYIDCNKVRSLVPIHRLLHPWCWIQLVWLTSSPNILANTVLVIHKHRYNKKVLLRERKRHTACRVASPTYLGWEGGGGYLPSLGGGTYLGQGGYLPWPGGYLPWPGWGTPPPQGVDRLET